MFVDGGEMWQRKKMNTEPQYDGLISTLMSKGCDRTYKRTRKVGSGRSEKEGMIPKLSPTMFE